MEQHLDTLLTLRILKNGGQFSDEIFKNVYLRETFCTLFEICMKIVPSDPIKNKSVLVTYPAPSHDPNQCGPNFMIPSGVTRSQWVNQ